MNTLSFRINQAITAKEVRLLREDGTQVGVVTLDEALSQAKDLKVDAVEVAPAAMPPVVKLIDYKKFLYQLAKKEQSSKASAKKVDLKEVRLTPFMADNDFNVKMQRVREFLSEGHKVRICVKFVGRQFSRKEFGEQVMTKAANAIAELANLEQEGRWVGKQFMAVFSKVQRKNNL